MLGLFKKRHRFNGDVASLLPAFGFTLDECGIFAALNALDTTWEQQYTIYESALLMAYTVYGGMLERKEPRAKDVISKISYIQKEWISTGIVSPILVERLSKKVEALQEKFESTDIQDHGNPSSTQPSIEFISQLPDPETASPTKIYNLGQFTIMYYTNAKTIAEAKGVSMGNTSPQIAVVTIKIEPICIISAEQGMFGTSMLCKIDPSGIRSNFGPFDTKDKSEFLLRVEQIVEEL